MPPQGLPQRRVSEAEGREGGDPEAVSGREKPAKRKKWWPDYQRHTYHFTALTAGLIAGSHGKNQISW